MTQAFGPKYLSKDQFVAILDDILQAVKALVPQERPPVMTQAFGPKYLSKDQFVAILDDILQAVKADDSWEGSLSYEFPMESDPKGVPGFRVRATYRIGNTMGQGGMRMIGEWV